MRVQSVPGVGGYSDARHAADTAAPGEPRQCAHVLLLATNHSAARTQPITAQRGHSQSQRRLQPQLVNLYFVVRLTIWCECEKMWTLSTGYLFDTNVIINTADVRFEISMVKVQSYKGLWEISESINKYQYQGIICNWSILVYVIYACLKLCCVVM